MQIMILRHCERSRSLNGDPQLTEYGLAKSQNLVTQVADIFGDPIQTVFHSPKKRCEQTVSFYCQKHNFKKQALSFLDERSENEDSDEFLNRINVFIKNAEASKTHIIACTHLDWIQNFLKAVFSKSDMAQDVQFDCAPGGFMVFNVGDGLWHFVTEGVL
jgi:phosphohistidine phosphatase SixA